MDGCIACDKNNKIERFNKCINRDGGGRVIEKSILDTDSEGFCD